MFFKEDDFEQNDIHSVCLEFGWCNIFLRTTWYNSFCDDRPVTNWPSDEPSAGWIDRWWNNLESHKQTHPQSTHLCGVNSLGC